MCLMCAMCLQELDRLPNGDSTVIGKLGVKLSLTCMAKITLARFVSKQQQLLDNTG